MRVWIVFSAIFVVGILGSTTTNTEQLQLQSIVFKNVQNPTTTTKSTTTATTTITTTPSNKTISSTTPSSTPTTTTTTTPTPIQPIISCSEVTAVSFCDQKVAYACAGEVVPDDQTTSMIITVTDDKGTVSLPKTATWAVNYTVNSKVVTLSGKFTPSTGDNKMFSVPETVTGANNMTVTVNYMRLLTKTVKESNTQAVVVAVLEGLVIIAILIVFAYKECFAKGKQRPPSSFTGPGTASYSANPYGSSGTGVSYGTGNGNGSYYDGAAAAYRQNNGAGSTTMRNESYGYDQPIRMEDRAARPTETTTTPATTPNRVQTEVPALVPVPLGTDPLNQWGDQRTARPADDLFS